MLRPWVFKAVSLPRKGLSRKLPTFLKCGSGRGGRAVEGARLESVYTG